MICFPLENENIEAFEFFQNMDHTYIRMDHYGLDKLFSRTYFHKTYLKDRWKNDIKKQKDGLKKYGSISIRFA